MKVKPVTTNNTKQVIFKDEKGNNFTWNELKRLAQKKGYIYERPYNKNIIFFRSPRNLKVIETFKPDIENYLNNLWKVK